MKKKGKRKREEEEKNLKMEYWIGEEYLGDLILLLQVGGDDAAEERRLHHRDEELQREPREVWRCTCSTSR